MPRRTWPADSLVWAAAFVLGGTTAAPAADDDLARPIAVLRSVGREGKANEDAGPAWKEVVGRGRPALFAALSAVDDANPTAGNWLRTAAGAIAEAEAAAGRPLPADELETFARDTKHAPSARRVAYELLAARDKSAAEKLLPGFLDDPSPDLRRDAVSAGLAKLDSAGGVAPRADLERLFAAARDQDQVEDIAKKLVAIGVKVSVTEHFAFVTQWHLIGPFESVQGKALSTRNPPEEKVDRAEKLHGKGGAEVAWKPVVSTDRMGKVDLNTTVGKLHDAAVYAVAVVRAEQATPVEIRVASPNAVQIFLNGKQLFAREEYHHGSSLDFHVGKGVLTAGKNEVLLKVCQNNQTDSWAQSWQFQLRVCDSTGGKLPGVTQQAVEPAGASFIPLGFVPATPGMGEKK